MKKLIISAAVSIACMSAWSADHSSAIEVSAAVGHDYGTKQSLTAYSIAAPLGNTGLKGILEYAPGRHGELGTDVTSIKVAKEVFAVGHAEFAINGGMGHLTGMEEETRISGNGYILGAEVAYPIAAKWALKLEASRFFGTGSIKHVKANVVQAGVIYKF